MADHPRATTIVPGLFAPRYAALDSFRGLAALAVVIHHGLGIHIGTQAVMIFFVISGYCIAAACQSARRAGIGMKGFMIRRVRRIYPPYFFSLVFWAATRIVKLRQGGSNDLLNGPLMWVQNLTLTQWTTLLFKPGIFPANNGSLFVAAYWSLGYEEQFYLVMGALFATWEFGRAAPHRAVWAMTALGLLWIAVFPHTVFGIFIEYWVPFALGALVFFRLSVYARRDARRAVDASLALITLGSAVALWRGGGFPAPLLGDIEIRCPQGEVLVAGTFALGLIALRSLDDRLAAARWMAPLRGLGTITYSLYLVHMFLLPFAKRVAEGAWRGRAGSAPIVVTQLAMVVAVSTVFWYFCERPFLNRPLRTPAISAGPPAPLTPVR